MQVGALWSKPHYACASGNLDVWLRNRLAPGKADAGAPRPDFVGLAQYEHDGALHQTLDAAGYAAVGAGCYARGAPQFGDVIGLAYDRSRWQLAKSLPAGQCAVPQRASEVQCGWDGAAAHCCACTADPSSAVAPGGPSVGARAYVAGLFREAGSARELCVVAASLPHPYPDSCALRGEPNPAGLPACATDAAGNSAGAGDFARAVEGFCGGADVLLLADTNLVTPGQRTAHLFAPGSRLAALNDSAAAPGLTCCWDETRDGQGGDGDVTKVTANSYASDRIAATGQVTSWGGAAAPGQPVPASVDARVGVRGQTAACPPWPPSVVSPAVARDFPCCGGSEEHLPVFASVSF
jgi:hypothetical protein